MSLQADATIAIKRKFILEATALQYNVFPFNTKNREQPGVEPIKFVEMIILKFFVSLLNYAPYAPTPVLFCVLLQLKGKVRFVYSLQLTIHLFFLIFYHISCLHAFFSFFYFKPLVTPLFIQLFCNIIQVSSKNEGEDLMKMAQ